LKYGGRVSSGLALGRKLGEHLCERSRLDILSGVVPVPLHRTKERERGFNQSEVIARGLAEVTGLPVCRENLRRTRFTVSQTRLSAAERHLNVGDAFEVPRQSRILTEGKRFLLVDDVITTGATTAAAASALISAGSLPPVACAVALAH
jgi:ComF family protein